MKPPPFLLLALRDLRGGWRGLRIVLACLALGVAAIATVGGLRAAVEGGIASHAREILGGDLDITSGQAVLPDALRQWLSTRGARLSAVDELSAMLIAANGERQVVSLKAVDQAWPLVGAPTLTPPQPLPTAETGLLVERLVLDRLGLKIGDTVRLGGATLRIQGILVAAPDRAATPSLVGPQALVSAATLARTGLVQPGSMVTYALRAAFPPGANVPAIATGLRAAFPESGWRIRGVHDAIPGATQFIDQLAVFFSLVGLTSLLVGGIGVATGVRAWLDGRARTIATLRCLGASGATVFAVALTEVAFLAVLGIGLGVLAGAILPPLALYLLRNALPVPPTLGLYPASLGLAALFGVLVALTFALPPLGRVLRIKGGALFHTLLPQPARLPVPLLATTLALAAALVALTVLTSPDPRLAFGFCLAALATLALFRLGAAGLIAAARRIAPRSAPLRLGIGNLHRPGNATPLMLVALGLGLSTLAAVALIQGNMARQIAGQLPRQAPSFYFIDIQPDQLDPFTKLATSAPGATDFRHLPYMLTRVTAVNGIPVARLHPTPNSDWAMHGDRGLALTYAASPPPGTHLAAGQWWPASYAGKPLLSFDSTLAAGWGVKLGDTITVNLLGRPVTLTIANFRRVDWRSLSMNFAMIGSPGLLSGAPHTELATLRIPASGQGALLRRITDALPNVTGILVADVLASVARLLNQIGTALTATGSLTLASGALVLAGAVASGQRRRIAEAVILKAVGATRRQIRTAWLVEFGTLGAAAGLIAAAIGSAASFATMRFIMHAPWLPLPARLVATIAACIAMMLLFGYIGTETALRTRAGPLLRNE